MPGIPEGSLYRDQLGQGVGNFDASEVLLTFLVAHHHGQVQAEIRDVGKGAPGSNASGVSTGNTCSRK